MAINSIVLDLLVRIAARVPAPRRLLCLGYPDMLVTESQIAAICGEEVAHSVEWRDDSEPILKWHGVHDKMQRLAESRSLFRLLGMQTDFVDLVASRGFEIVVDLNGEAPAELHGRYDIVYDGGTLEHCFNVGQVMRNIIAFARVGGFIMHVNPLNYYNHGFFNFNPTFYHDWYTQSGNAIVSPFYAMHGPVLESQLGTLDAVKKFRVPERSVLVVAAMKRSAAQPGWPRQTKYLEDAELRG